jgi:O-acetylserine/cysteine efflux transporter
LIEEGQWSAIASSTVGDWSALLFLAVCGFVIAYSIWYRLLSRYRVDQVTPFTLLMPFFGVLAGALLLGERVTGWEMAGGAVIMAGLAAIVLMPPRPTTAAAE